MSKVNIHGHVAPRETTATGEAVFKHAMEILRRKREKLEESAAATRREREELIESIADKRLKRSAREG